MLCKRCGSYNADLAPKCSVCGQDFSEERGKTLANLSKKPSQTGLPSSIFVPGETVAGRYRIGELLGQGGVGAVYRARDLEIDVDVALKAISPNLLQTEEEQKNFSKQIRAARKLQHPNIVRLYDEGHEGPRRFFTMKLLEGLTLRKIIRLRHEKGQAFTAEELTPIFQQLAAAFDYAHRTTWHGDLKPENVVILPDLLKVTDFNLVKALPLKPFLGIAKSRSKGFPYIAPELRVEATHIDGRCDVYSMGVVLAEMLTGLVYEGHFTRALTAALEQLPTKLDGLVRRALSEHPDGRFQKATDMATELEAALAALPKGGLPPPVSTTPSTPPTAAASKPPRPAPPPLPRDEPTNPRAVQGDVTDEDAQLPAEEVQRSPTGDVEPPMIGQSQVVLLESLTHKPGFLAEAARRILVTGEDSQEASRTTSGDVRESGPSSSGRQGLRADDLIETLYSDEDQASLIPPPLPDGTGPDVTNDDADKLDDERDDPRRDDSNEITAENPRIAGRKNAPVPLASSDPNEGPRASAEDDDHAPIDGGDDSIHDALTALKAHPRPDLADDDEIADPFAAGTATALPGKMPPKASEDDDDEPSLPPHVVAAAQERSSPRLRAAPPVPAPVVAPKSGLKPAPRQPSGKSSAKARDERPAIAPPGMRPVAPPQKRDGGAGRNLVVVAAAVAAAVILFGLVSVFRQPATPPTAIVDAGAKPADLALAPIPPPPLAPLVAASADAGKAAVEDPKIAAQRAEEARQAEEIRKLEDAKNAIAAAQARIEAQNPGDRQRLIEEEKKRAEERALADAKAKADAEAKAQAAADKKAAEDAKKPPPAKEDPKVEEPVVASVPATDAECPRGMAKIEAGSFTMGSQPSDDMRNFGEKTSERVDVAAYCIDYYEYPNGKSASPTTNVTWQAAKNLCESKGKRLCSEAEWERACKGPANLRFPYGNTYDADACNTVDGEGRPRALGAAQDFKGCRTGFKVFAMAGNAEEWTADAFQGGSKTVKGGSADRPDFASRCAARRGLSAKTAGGSLGFRCCADLE